MFLSKWWLDLSAGKFQLSQLFYSLSTLSFSESQLWKRNSGYVSLTYYLSSINILLIDLAPSDRCNHDPTTSLAMNTICTMVKSTMTVCALNELTQISKWQQIDCLEFESEQELSENEWEISVDLRRTQYQCWPWMGGCLYAFFVCADLVFHIFHLSFKLCFAATASSGLWKICPWLIDSGKGSSTRSQVNHSSYHYHICANAFLSSLAAIWPLP